MSATATSTGQSRSIDFRYLNCRKASTGGKRSSVHPEIEKIATSRLCDSANQFSSW